MTSPTPPRRPGFRAGAVRLLVPVAVLVAAAGATSACSHPVASTPDQDAAASKVVASLGAVPIPSVAPGVPTATADGRRPALLAMGAPVRVRLGRTTAVVTATGPTQSTTYNRRRNAATVGTITVALRPVAGRLSVSASDFSSRDQTGTVVRLRPVGATHAAASSAQPAQLRLSGRFNSGAAELTWRHGGRVVAVWDFTIELD